MALEAADISRLVAAGWKPPIPFTVKARDGTTDLYGLMYRPSRFDSTRAYPIIDHIYPGPQLGSVGSRAFRTARGDAQALAELGFIVVELDGMGTPFRSKHFHDAWYGNLADNTLPDQVAGMKELARRYQWIDLERAGIYGHSGGGFATADAMFRYPDFFKVGVSEAGNHDNRTYVDDWGEKYQGLEMRQSDGTSNYDSQANAPMAKNLKGTPPARPWPRRRQCPTRQHASGRTRADAGEQGFRPDHPHGSRPWLRGRPIHGAPALGLFRSVLAGRRATRVCAPSPSAVVRRHSITPQRFERSSLIA